MGHKTITLMPELMRRGAQLGATEAQAHIGELQEMIKQRRDELKAAEGSQ